MESKAYRVNFPPLIYPFYFLKVYFVDYAIMVVPFFSTLFPSALYPMPPSFPHLSSRPWVVHISSLASPFPMLYLTSSCLCCTYLLCFLFSVPFPPSALLPHPTGSPPRDLHFCNSLPVLVVCLVCFCFGGFIVDSCEFVVILRFSFLIFFFLLDKSL